MNGTFQEFLDALRAFESGWDRKRYEAGIIVDWQLDQWAGGTVSELFPGYTSWSQLTEAEWDAMAYRSMNSLGFVGYQFGEALLIDLGWYEADVFYGAGAARNTWQGDWTGRNGVDSLEEFMTAKAQEIAIREAFGFNLDVIVNGLAQSGIRLEELIGQTATYIDNGVPRTVGLTLTGILAAAHLRGAWGTLALLQNGAVSQDEYGTSILRYVDQFGGYDAPLIEELIAFYETGSPGDELPGGHEGTTPPPSGDADPIDPPADETPGGTAGPSSVDVLIDWSWGSQVDIHDFNPQTDVFRIAWIGAANLSVYENAAGDAVFAVPSNQQTTTLIGVGLDDL
ncbi:MAG: 1,4-beta-glucanase, partial [Pseudomonadota bacterium]